MSERHFYKSNDAYVKPLVSTVDPKLSELKCDELLRLVFYSELYELELF
jgi:hypothetical protein